MIMFQQFSNGMKYNCESAKSKKMGDIMCFLFRGGYDFMLFHDLSGQMIIIFPPTWIFNVPFSRNFSPQKKRPKIYVTGLKNDMKFMTWMSVLYCGCRPWLFWSLMSFGSMLKLQGTATILAKDIRRFDGTIRVGKKNNHTPGNTVHYILGEKRTSITREQHQNSTWIIRPFSRCWLFCAKLHEVACLYSFWYVKTRKFSPQSPDPKSFFGA